jgi:glycosyltransferase involved in cell wall biosynthesis
MTDPLGQSQVIPYLKDLKKAGYQIALLSFEKKSQETAKTMIFDKISSAGIIWKPLRYHKKPALAATIYDIIIGTIYTLIYCKKYNIKIIHCRSYLPALMAYLVRPFHNFRFIFDMRGFWADERIEGGIWDPGNFLHKYQYRFFKWMEKKFIKKADQVITLTEKAKIYIENNYDLKRSVEVIPCSCDLTLFQYHSAVSFNPLLQQAKEQGKMILVYLGSVGTWYMLEPMFQFFKVFKQLKDAVFLIISPSSHEFIRKQALKNEVALSDLIITKAKRNEIPDLLSQSDAGIFFIKPVFSKIASSPVKHGEMLGCGLPVVINSGIGDMDRIIKNTGTGVILEDWQIESMQKAANYLIHLIEKKNASYYRSVAKQYYSLEAASHKYASIYSILIKSI